MISYLISWKSAIGGLAIVALIVAWRYADTRLQRQIGAEEATKAIERAINDQIKKGIAASDAANSPGSAQRLRKKYCRNCQ